MAENIEHTNDLQTGVDIINGLLKTDKFSIEHISPGEYVVNVYKLHKEQMIYSQEYSYERMSLFINGVIQGIYWGLRFN